MVIPFDFDDAPSSSRAFFCCQNQEADGCLGLEQGACDSLFSPDDSEGDYPDDSQGGLEMDLD